MLAETLGRANMKWRKFRAGMRMHKIGVKELSASALDGKILFQWDKKIDENFELPG